MTLVVLQNDFLRLTILPKLGACIAGFEIKQGDFWLPVMRPMSVAALAQGSSPDSSSYLLAPYSNRIKDGRFSFGGEDFQLRPNWTDGRQTIHGEVHRRAWHIVEQSAEMLVCRFEASAGLNFPFAYSIEVGFRLDGPSALLELKLTNTNPGPLPAGFGHHPFFMRSLGGSEDGLVQFRAQKVYLTDSSCIPSEPAVAVPAKFDFSQPRAIGSTFLDNVFTGWDGRLSLDWGRYTMTLEASPIFSHLVVFTAPDGSVALEPVTHATDGFNLMNRGFGDVGVKVLEPGQNMEGSVRIELTQR